jgi:type I restriction enzyme S subunit
MGATKRLKRYDTGVVSPLYICFRLTGADSTDFYEQYFESGVMNTELEAITQEGARNHGMLNISIPGFFSDITIPRPSLEEQTRIAGFLMALDAKVAGVARAVEAAQRWKKGLLQQMFV